MENKAKNDFEFRVFNLNNFNLKLKTIIMFVARSLFFKFYTNGHIQNVVPTLPNVSEIDV